MCECCLYWEDAEAVTKASQLHKAPGSKEGRRKRTVQYKAASSLINTWLRNSSVEFKSITVRMWMRVSDGGSSRKLALRPKCWTTWSGEVRVYSQLCLLGHGEQLEQKIVCRKEGEGEGQRWLRGLQGNQGRGACAKVDFLGGESLARGKDWEQPSGAFEGSQWMSAWAQWTACQGNTRRRALLQVFLRNIHF